MNLLDHLLGPAAAGSDPLLRHATLEDEIAIFFEESIADEDIAIGSWPGHVLADDWLASLEKIWVKATPHALDDRARDAISVDPVTGRMLLLSLWPRALLTRQMLTDALEAHKLVHRHWHQALLPPEDDSAEPDPPLHEYP